MGKKSLPSTLHDTPDRHLTVSRGKALPLGASVQPGGINFAIFSRHARAVILTLFRKESDEPWMEFKLDPELNRTGDVWHIFIHGLDAQVEYGYRMDGPTANDNPVYRYDQNKILLDPYSRVLSGNIGYGQSLHLRADSGHAFSRHSLAAAPDFDWGDDHPLNIHLADSIIYELHIRGFTRHPSSGVRHPGTYKGLIEKIPYLKELGITAVELLPVMEFEENDNPNRNPFTGEQLKNYWGYHSISFFTPKASYAYSTEPAMHVNEFREMVRALHQAGIEVILDIVFNHTAEGNENGPTFSFRGIDNPVYYMVDPRTGAYLNFSGCGNTLNCNHPVVRDLIIDCLRYWVTEMHVDGFRFDLASILGRDSDGSVLSNPPLLERIAADPVLARVKLIAEAWDAGGLYQVGTFPNWGRWAEWNGKFRDDIRRVVKSDAGMMSTLATRLVGSPDLYYVSGRAPHHSINFITCHDGFTLADLVSYNQKHNEINGENNRDGSDENFSWNCGMEGPTDHPEILHLRQRQMKNMVTLLFMSQGVPMILAGDEMARSQQGNNNAYCQDNEISWLNWHLLKNNQGLFRFFRLFIQFRKDHPLLRSKVFYTSQTENAPVVVWHGFKRYQPDWSEESRSLGMQLIGGDHDNDIYLIVNAHWEDHEFELPVPSRGKSWKLFVDTYQMPPYDIYEKGKEPLLYGLWKIRVKSRSMVVLISE